jgi:hypothetical protein
MILVLDSCKSASFIGTVALHPAPTRDEMNMPAKRRRLFSLPKLKVAVMINDTTATLASCVGVFLKNDFSFRFVQVGKFHRNGCVASRTHDQTHNC